MNQHETHWTLVAKASSPEDTALEAVDELRRICLPVLRGMLTCRPQLNKQTKENLLQSFV